MNINDDPINTAEIKILIENMEKTIKSIDEKITHIQRDNERRLKEQSNLDLTEHEKETNLYDLISNEKIERLVVERNHWKHEIKKLLVDLETQEHLNNY